MANIAQLLTEHMDIWTAAETEKKSGRGRASGNGSSVYGVKKLRELILELAVRGKLVPQDPNDEPASELLKRIQAEKARLIAEGKMKKEKPLAPIMDDEKPFELPQGWGWVKLSEVAFSQAGFAFKSNAFNEDARGLPLIRIRDVGQEFTGTYYDGEYREEFLVNTGDFLISMDGEFRVAAWQLGEALLNQRVSRLIFYGNELARNFIAISLQNRLRELQGSKAYTTVDHLSGGQISNSVIGLPPFAEQHRIVAKVDELMALCDELEQQHSNAQQAHETLVSQLLATLTQSQNATEFNANWQRIYAHFDLLFTTEASIDALKQTLLQLAVMGKLVPQDPNDEPASELLKRIQAEKAKLIAEGKLKKEKPATPIGEDEKLFELPKGWEWVRLAEITSIRGGSTPSMAKSDFWGGDIPWISPKDMHDGIILNSELKLTQKALRETNLELVPIGSVLIVGRSGILKRKLPAEITGILCTINQDLKAVTPIKPLGERYLQLIFKGNEQEILIRDVKQGTTVQSLVYDSLFKRPFSLPPINEQRRIVAKVDELMALCDQLKTRLQQAGQQQQAIADALVAQAVA